MENPEKITGRSMLRLLDQIKKERTALKLHILGAGGEGLSILLGIKKVNENPCMILDFPAGPGYDILFSQGKKVIIEFTDKKKIRYDMSSLIEWVDMQNMYVLMPNYIRRIQRRKFFRIPPPKDTKVIINDEDGKFEFNVLDISEGGVLISHPSSFHDDEKFFESAQKSLSIVYREDGKIKTIRINKAEIKRVRRIRESGCYNYAFQFTDCGRHEEDHIRNFIYSCQRRYLKDRQSEDEDML